MDLDAIESTAKRKILNGGQSHLNTVHWHIRFLFAHYFSSRSEWRYVSVSICGNYRNLGNPIEHRIRARFYRKSASPMEPLAQKMGPWHICHCAITLNLTLNSRVYHNCKRWINRDRKIGNQITIFKNWIFLS